MAEESTLQSRPLQLAGTASPSTVPPESTAPPPPPAPEPVLAKAPEVVKRSMPLAISIAIGIFLAGFFAWFFYELTWYVLLMYLSLVLATIVEAPVSYLKRKGVPRTLGTVLILGSGLLLLGGVIYLLVVSLNAQMTTLTEDIKNVPERINTWVNGFKHRFPGIGETIKDYNFAESIGNMIPTTGAVWLRISASFEVITYIVVTFFTVMYMVIDGPSHLKAMRRALPKNARLNATHLFEDMAKTHRGWFIASVCNVASSAILSTFGLWLVGVPGAFVLGVVAGFGELIPNIGPALFAVPAVAVSLLIKPELTLWVVLMFAIVQTIQSYTITPMMMRVSVELPVLVTIVSVVVMGVLFGLLGVFVAIPLVADLVVLWNYLSAHFEKDTGDNDQTNAAPESQQAPSGAGSPHRPRSLFRRLRKSGASPALPA